ncbi:sigma-70 family RNA polymerase sigma factor [Lachnoclostridium sp. Marseille-P6806]|uniref:sigma-70 family RNA polymerase sigma factor n=1 Tax=Lachnoclostridium sp. Marseille-P6806 TaxID=2364793 RepID=UPI0010325439|nr:sigma-70 family RNA polymerase sigma factor [Lachnoclostridium sp. Marseille-P6806]
MTEDKAYKVHIQYTFNAFCKVVIRHAAIDIILKLLRRWEREVSLDYLMNEKFIQFAEPEQTQVEIFRYYFLRQPQRVIGVHISRTRSTAGRHIQLALKRLRRLMKEKRYE